MEERLEKEVISSTDEINELLERLKFSEEESVQVVSTSEDKMTQGFESWAVGKIMAREQPNREAMYRVFKSLWYTKEEVDFVSLKEGVIIVKFGCLEDRSRILNLMPWLFDRCLFVMVPFEKGKNFGSYEFCLSPFWLRVYSLPLELMDRQMALNIGNAIGELMAIDWKDQDGGWTAFMRLKVKINILKPLKRVVRLVDKEGMETIGVIKYERLPDLCYACGLIGHSFRTCESNKEEEEVGQNGLNLQYGGWLRVPIVNPNQDRGMRRNGVELVKSKAQTIADKEESHTNSRDENGLPEQKGKERICEKESLSVSPQDRRSHKMIRDGMRRFKSKRKRYRGSNDENLDESQAKLVKRRILDNASPLKAAA
ncbi:hypothetical protein Gotri_027574 [Gossypium trilobum]|uniref:Zinc knuckle CX2CX4HX4C domain-containing protein n=1 Tax=Gossypium trilobum TaxID=34281 RepID=A0A7J9FVF5_9ROSI|nr:hypothetical protein [Gossypium trilobum]